MTPKETLTKLDKANLLVLECYKEHPAEIAIWVAGLAAKLITALSKKTYEHVLCELVKSQSTYDSETVRHRINAIRGLRKSSPKTVYLILEEEEK